MTYAEKRDAKKKTDAAQLEDELAAPAGFAAGAEHALTEEEKEVIENKGTEAAGTGAYDRFYPTTGGSPCTESGKT